ncbi:MAG TPA: zinc-binding dehydrogenase, partial [Acidimicrobiales bacterium]|nr:zinc-binding dehydrogenase [Acidimicrobiales bacterium]
PGGGPVLVTGASGGVGSFAVAVLAGRGYEVVASTGKQDEHDWLRHLGAARVVGRDELDEGAGKVLGPERWAGAVDCVGGATLARVLRSLRYGAAVAASGLTGGSDLVTTVYPFITRNVALLGVDSVRTPGPQRRAVWARLGGDLRPAHLEAMVGAEVPLAGVGPVLADILEGRVRGRVVVAVGPGT